MNPILERRGYIQRALVAVLTYGPMVVGMDCAFGAEAWIEAAASNTRATQPKIKLLEKRADVDQVITNPRLRAKSGSRDTLSMQSNIWYWGGSMADPFSANRPALSPGQAEVDPAKISGAISAKYRITDEDNLNVGTGYAWTSPARTGQAGQVENPFVAYSRTFKFLGNEAFWNVYTNYITSRNSRENFKLNYNVGSSITLARKIPETRWQLGLSVGYQRNVYTESTEDRALSNFGIGPSVEYWFNDYVSVNTGFGGLSYYNLSQRPEAFEQDPPTQSVGFGFVVTRDIFISPRVDWLLSNASWESTNVALGAMINL